jgi:hypothetical protein
LRTSRVFVKILSLELWASSSLDIRRPLLPSLSTIRASPSILTTRSSSVRNGKVLSSTRSFARYRVCRGPTRWIFASARVTISYQLSMGRSKTHCTFNRPQDKSWGSLFYILPGRVGNGKYPQAFADWPKNSSSKDPLGKGARVPVSGNSVLGPGSWRHENA